MVAWKLLRSMVSKGMDNGSDDWESVSGAMEAMEEHATFTALQVLPHDLDEAIEPE